MTAVVRWFPVGHIAHGYRRVFVTEQDGELRHVVVMVPMPYEAVYRVKQLAGDQPVADPSLWWGLSVLRRLAADGVLLNPDHPGVADDGYLQLRPPMPSEADLIPLDAFQEALKQGRYPLVP
ncbi:MAG: hypothetical protein K6T81_01385 [Alicyclobacillus macrosporangiidus]|uniref:hypothetical protein n=1 Tax=Alicyclobacillus macrosporangiidus TaxID=392015 RepID=UPI0026EA5267|nr:hypothetical protein [Alicyclobacillus macrosporangiidus]MCL6597374.1 hypothetical protein [Alicyclobacillus macrosporangiidus]